MQGVTLPVPLTLEPLEHKMPERVLKNFHTMDFLKVILYDFSDFRFIISFNFQKCVDKDPAKRWSCDRLLTHVYFEDYIRSNVYTDSNISINSRRKEEKSGEVGSVLHL